MGVATSCHIEREWHIENCDNVPIVLLPNAVGDVGVIASILYAVSESSGGTSGGSVTCLPGNTADLYNDGVDVFTLVISVLGAVSVYRSLGAAVFDARIHIVWV